MEGFSSIPVPPAGGMGGFAPLPPPLPQVPHDSASLSSSGMPEHDDAFNRLVAHPYGSHDGAAADPAARAIEHAQARKEQHVEEAQAKESAYSIHVGTGSDFHRKGRFGLDKQLAHKALHDKASFSGVSEDDRKLLGNVIEKHAHNLSTGAKLGYTARREMKESIQKAKEEGHITYSDSQKFKKIIDELH